MKNKRKFNKRRTPKKKKTKRYNKNGILISSERPAHRVRNFPGGGNINEE